MIVDCSCGLQLCVPCVHPMWRVAATPPCACESWWAAHCRSPPCLSAGTMLLSLSPDVVSGSYKSVPEPWSAAHCRSPPCLSAITMLLSVCHNVASGTAGQCACQSMVGGPLSFTPPCLSANIIGFLCVVLAFCLFGVSIIYLDRKRSVKPMSMDLIISPLVNFTGVVQVLCGRASGWMVSIVVDRGKVSAAQCSSECEWECGGLP
jgi:hypothetical protein